MANVDVVIPVYNEEHVLEQSVDTLRAFLAEKLPHKWRIVIADNASTDGTLAVAQRLAEKHDDVVPFHIPQKGRGRALRATWLGSDADVLSYMDVDLSTGIEFFPALVAAITDEGYDVAIGSRLKKGAETTRSTFREFTSRVYNLMIKFSFWPSFQDAQCGFKAVSRQAAQALVPLIKNEEWFFDTELLILADKGGWRLKEIPVRWREDPDTRVNIRKTAMEDIRGLTRMRFTKIPKKPSAS
jgi:glycosyltransferase involved in cell wall biosynthesis